MMGRRGKCFGAARCVPKLIEACEPRLLLFAWSPSGFTGLDDLAVLEVVAGQHRATVNGTVSFAPPGTTSIQLSTGTGDDNVTVQSTNLPVTVFSQGGFDRLNVSDNSHRTLDAINASITVDGIGGLIGIVAYDQNANASRNYDFDRNLSDGSFLQRSGSPHRIRWNEEVAAVHLHGANLGSSTFIQRSGSTQIVFSGGSGNDTVQVGFSLADLQAVVGASLGILLSGGAGANQLNYWDLNATEARNYVFETGFDALANPVNALGWDFSQRILYDATFATTFNAGGPDNQLDIRGQLAGSDLRINGGPGRNMFHIDNYPDVLDAALNGRLELVGLGSDDSLDVSDSITTSVTGKTYHLYDDRLERTDLAHPLRFSGMDELRVEATPLNDVLNIHSLPAGLPASVITGDGTDVVRFAPDSGDLFDIRSSVSVMDDTSRDIIQLFDSNVAGDFDYTITDSTFTGTGLPVHQFSTVSELTLIVGAGNNTIDIEGVPTAGINALTQIYAGAGDDQIRLRPIGGIGALTSLIIPYGQGGTNSILVDDSQASSQLTHLLEAGSLDRHVYTYGLNQRLILSDFADLQFVGSDLDTVFEIEATHAGLNTAITLGSGRDDVLLAPVGRNLNALAGALQIDMGANTNPNAGQAIFLHDRNHTGNDGFGFGPFGVSRGAGFLLAYNPGPDGTSMIVEAGSSPSSRNHLYTDPTPGGADFAAISFRTGSGPETIIVNDIHNNLLVQDTASDDSLIVQGTTATPVPFVTLSSSSGSAPFALALDSLTLSNHASVSVLDTASHLSPTPSNSTLAVNQLDITGAAQLDLGNHNLIWRTTQFSPDPATLLTTHQMLAAGYNAGHWNGTGGITSRAVAYNATQGRSGRSIGWGVAGDLLGFNSGSIAWRNSVVQPGNLLLSFTLAGDANLDRQVGFADLLIVAQNYNSSGKYWHDGNFDYDTGRQVGFSDLLLEAQNYGQTLLQSTPAHGDQKTRQVRSITRAFVDSM